MKRTVRRAYFLRAGKGVRVIADSRGQVFFPNTREWHTPTAGAQVVPVGQRYERWCDVPQAWLGYTPWWK